MELYVEDLQATVEFWGWFLERLGYRDYQQWDGGRSWRLADTYLVFVEAPESHADRSFHRRAPGLNHLAFHAGSREQVDALTREFRARGRPILYEDQHPYAGGESHYAVYFEDPNRLKVEVVAPGTRGSD